MKRILFLVSIAVLAISCQKDPIGSVAAKALAGEWSVTYQCVDDNGEVIDSNLAGEYLRVFTFNAANNATDSIFVADEQYFIAYQAKVPCNMEQKTFGTPDALENLYGASGYHGPEVIIDNGKILSGAATTPSGMPADSIYFELTFVGGDYYTSLYGNYGMEYTHYIVSGFRYTGLAGDLDGF